ncbi:hypothetical protein JTB14_016019 [Gonioctena quinquepunctata]|nr:hypothetical protein JTB14_016019 [Gonioctena quinquepunctata]
MEGKRKNFGEYSSLLFATLSTLLGLLLFIFPPYDILMDLRGRMSAGPVYNMWLEPPIDLVAKIYIFNITNGEEFFGGVDSKIKMREVGPIIYRQKVLHKNIVFNENGTFSYTSNRKLVYSPEDNPIDLRNATVIMPNLAGLVIPSYFANSPYMVKFLVNAMMRRHNTKLFKKNTIHEHLWNSTDAMADFAGTLAPGLFPFSNIGIMARVYADLETTATVYIAPKYDITEFFKLDKFDGSEYLPKRENTCHEKISGAFEDIVYHMNIKKNETLRYYVKALCTTMKTQFTSEVTRYGMTAYRFDMPVTFFHRTFPEERDCFKGSPAMPDGIIDCGPCYYDTSVASSYPHFLYGDENLSRIVDGMQPDKDKHETYVVVEPVTGVPIEGSTRLQINIVMKNMTGFNSQLQKLSGAVIPVAWVDYTGTDVPASLIWLIYLQVVIVPIVQVIIPCILLILGSSVILLYLRRRKNSINNFEKQRGDESDVFLKH